MHRVASAALTVGIILSAAALVAAQDRGPGGRRGPPGPLEEVIAGPANGIQWYGTWEGGLAEAKRTGKPILLVSAAPHCHNVSGVW